MYHIKSKKGFLNSACGKKSGQTLVEATIALASILLTLAAIAIAISTSVSNSQFIKLQSQAAKYAQDGMEQLRYERNTSPANFFARNGIYCMNEDSSLTPGSCTAVNIANTFKREAEFTQPSNVACGNNTRVAVNVYWSSGKCGTTNTFCHKSQLASCFANQTGTSDTL
ncbi:MAG: hypothetical protein A3C30_02175 [Candidatus Levybacteria bacterium RIFCSPHIGHO2_02_FULL_40_18]|nr:MAG: hypothetical protein A2869_04555 [Candidatus Levybacteria bacterium RIFCSPHIGHO2_01_FULL_40_58]OGH26796.1 MAG: hypothetical protein A3C30_02175 [Candidatus Levybacteria bacterium RIFCSPHIGHO2_02_FULL_40_18]OGH31731.1 MAG: hypothetical protein A3E43_01895 [Candidatus Levybacteria bacterium RIFCSPHIGHO2_12_FULL_40_31]OGH40631.1 MAG: hypothetical protein A2894_00445 [Candidatus Levybacteria bacterium RIFCSPLOWO2_01_FULL_40_64]OGH48803.1 MAG: hypothetical protein A3I54_04070 [Candidatus Lev